MSRHNFHRGMLAAAVTLACGTAFAQAAGSTQAKVISDAASESARAEAAAAREVALAARQAAADAASAAEAEALTAHGAASAEYHAHVARQASLRAQESARDAAEAANGTGTAQAAAYGGTATPAEAALAARIDDRRTERASLDTQQSAAEAVVSARAAIEAASSPPAPAPQPRSPTTTQLEPDVTVISHVADPALVAASRTFTRLDADGDGALSADEAAADPTLAAGFQAVDRNRDGSIDRDEYTAQAR
jgi:hypothetical protein